MTDRNPLAGASLSDIRQQLAALNRQGDLDAIPVEQPDDPTTAAILALLSAQQGAQQDK